MQDGCRGEKKLVGFVCLWENQGKDRRRTRGEPGEGPEEDQRRTRAGAFRAACRERETQGTNKTQPSSHPWDPRGRWEGTPERE
uniref:Uncharacterized protein n=1 Tax=Knipowitschia caucasica TaxID=637954 RepID=A0AAV2KDH6_KNICA